ncbi:hypothetical protein F0U59_25430 [Archangium gephyra]|nr:hypothetical protein F0U59_25430 [Archangium gephyra]
MRRATGDGAARGAGAPARGSTPPGVIQGTGDAGHDAAGGRAPAGGSALHPGADRLGDLGWQRPGHAQGTVATLGPGRGGVGVQVPRDPERALGGDRRLPGRGAAPSGCGAPGARGVPGLDRHRHAERGWAHQEAHREVHGESVPMPPVIELHGTLLETRCHDCDARPGRTAGSYVEAAAPRPPRCERCDGPLRPDVVLFGERVAPERMGQALELVRRCDALLVVGTAMDVAPASELPRIARANGVPVVELKRTASRLSRSLDTVLVPGESDTVLPELLENLRQMR